MEKLDILEQYVDSLLKQNAALRQEVQTLIDEKTRLADDLVLSQLTADDYQEQLKNEQAARGTAESRIDGMISRMLTALSEDAPSENGEAEAPAEEAAQNGGQNEVAPAEPEAGMDEIL